METIYLIVITSNLTHPNKLAVVKPISGVILDIAFSFCPAF